VNRKQKRDVVRAAKKEGKNLQDTLSLMGAMPEKCLTCAAPFDRMNKEQALSWHISIREKEAKVHLYCDTCWNAAQKIIEDFAKRISER